MKYVHPEITTVFDTDNGYYNTLVVEEQRFLLRLVEDIRAQLDGQSGQAVLSVRDKPVSFSHGAALLDTFAAFDMNRKPLLNQIATALSQRAATAEYFEHTSTILGNVELWLDDLAFGFPCDIVFPGISVPALIKAAMPQVRCECTSLAEKVLDFIELVEEFDRSRLFFTLNMRAFVPDDDMVLFADSVISHGYHIIGIECVARALLPTEKRIIIDADLCEIG